MVKTIAVLGAAIASALALTVSAGAAPCCLTNGSFETGDLTGWTSSLTGGSALVVAGGVSGAWHARVTTDGPGNWQTISQTRVGPAGRIFGWARFNDGEMSCSGYDDQAQVLVDNVVVWSASTCSTSSTPWQPFSRTVSNTGVHTVAVRVANGGDSIADSSADLDAVVWDARLSRVPPP